MEKDVVQEVFEDAGFECRSYSGRGMYGRSCLGVELDRGIHLGEFVSEVILELTHHPEGYDQVAFAFRSMKRDSMGLGEILYFPQIDFVGEDEDEDTCDSCGGPCPSKQCCDDCAELEVRS
jgi:hypothetical protein